MMARVIALESETGLSGLIDRLEEGERVTVMRRGQPIGSLVRRGRRVNREELRDVIARIKAFGDAHANSDLPIRDMIDEGRL